MTKKEIKERIARLRKLYEEEKYDDARVESENFVLELFKEKKYRDIVEADKKIGSVPVMFEVAYSYNEIGDYNKAKENYKLLLTFPGKENNIAILNNLSNLEKQERNIDKAFELIKKAYELSKGKDGVINNNYNNILRIVEEKEEKEAKCINACDFLNRETDWALDKLLNFITKIKKERDFKDNKIPIPRWKFKVLMGTDDIKADSLREQWLKRSYIFNTKEKGSYGEIVYEINPYIEKSIQKLTPFKLEKDWTNGIDRLNVEELEQLQYFFVMEKIDKTSKKYKHLLKRDFDELVINYIFKNKKAVIVLSGSFVELLFNYHCEKRKIKKIEYNVFGKKIAKDVYKSTLNDFLKYFEQDKDFKKVIIAIGNLSRIYRNFVHPGNEIKNKENLEESKMELCFHSVLEVIKYLL